MAFKRKSFIPKIELIYTMDTVLQDHLQKF